MYFVLDNKRQGMMRFYDQPFTKLRCQIRSKPKQQAVKQECDPQKGQDEKDVKSKVAAKKWL